MVSCATLRHQLQCALLGLWLCLGQGVGGIREVFLLMVQGWSTMPSTPNLLTPALAAGSIQLTRNVTLTLSLYQTSSIKRMNQGNFRKSQQIMSSRLDYFTLYVRCNTNGILPWKHFLYFFHEYVMLFVTNCLFPSIH